MLEIRIWLAQKVNVDLIPHHSYCVSGLRYEKFRPQKHGIKINKQEIVSFKIGLVVYVYLMLPLISR